MKSSVALLFFLLLCGSGTARAQVQASTPTDFPGLAVSDSLDYSAREIDYNLEEKTAVMRGNAVVRYLGYTLRSHRIVYYQDSQYVIAEGRRDSTGVLVDTPVFVDKGGEELRGRTIEYNLATGEGLIVGGRTRYENGFIGFDTVKRVSEDTLYISNGTYTTCETEPGGRPHYYFAGKQMKLIVNDKLIIKPITAYVHDIPVFWFPFYVFPISQGRQSGFLTPRWGSSRQDGRYLSNLGYYFAASEYWDYRAAATLRERNGWLVKNWLDYNVRYKMTGSVYASFEERPREGSREWLLRASHSQTVSPTLQITGDANFQSSEFSRFNSSNIYEQLNRNVRSSLNVTKRWKESGNSLILNLSHDKNLDTQRSSTTLPNVSFRMPRKLLFGGDDEKAVQRKYVRSDGEERDPEDRAWYESIYYSMNTDFRNTNDVVEQAQIRENTYSRNLGFSSSLSSSNKFRGWLVAEPSLNLSENFVATNSDADSIKYRRRDNLTFGLGLGTTVYGTFLPNIGNVRGIRHVLAPTVNWSFGKSRQYFADSPDAFVRFDRNDADNPTVNALNLNLRNIFQVKTQKGEEENKFDLFTLNFSSGVNFEAERRKVAPLQTTLDFRPSRMISTRLSASHTFYNSEDRFNPLSPTLESLTFTTDVGISRESLRFLSASSRPSYNSQLGRDDLDLNGDEIDEAEGIGTGTSALPFNLRLSHTYGLRRDLRTGRYVTAHDIKPEISFSPSPNFSVNYFLYYDVENRDLVSHRVSVRRDLHCFEASLNWIPSGLQEGFYFRVNIKDLPDVKLERRRGSSRIGY